MAWRKKQQYARRTMEFQVCVQISLHRAIKKLRKRKQRKCIYGIRHSLFLSRFCQLLQTYRKRIAYTNALMDSYLPTPAGPSCLLSSGSVCMLYSQSGQAGSRARVPQLDRLLVVLAAGRHQRFGGVPVHTLHVRSVTWLGQWWRGRPVSGVLRNDS